MLTWPASDFQQILMISDVAAATGKPDPGFTLSSTARVRGPLDVECLDAAFDDVVARNDILRTTLVQEHGMWCQQVHPHRTVSLERIEAAGRSPAELAQAWSAVPIAADRPPVIRGFLSRLSDDDHLVGLSCNHLYIDARSITIAVQELAQAYEARLAGRRIAPLALQYGAYVQHQLSRPRDEETLRSWLRTSGTFQPMSFPCDRDCGDRTAPVPASFQATVLRAADVRRLERWALSHRTTPFCALLTGFALAVAARIPGRDLAIPSIIEKRGHPDTRTMIGPFLHPVILRMSVPAGSSWETLTPTAREAVLAAYEHTHIPLSEVHANSPDMPRFSQRGGYIMFQYLPRYGSEAPIPFGAAVGATVDPESLAGRMETIGITVRLRHAPNGDLIGWVGHDLRDHSEGQVRALFDDFAAALTDVVRPADGRASRKQAAQGAIR
ncbi:condensation domain-containing protein [Frankia sp. AgB32]|uniref:condensation domain-containing protein n=1 Tax=Frankia sp. AgB32 TaxID=631119 RepID=UPI00200EDE1E|nr:condensation domain-containing protein [Frankia sp. AgB32]MCK9894228.1 condensation domain-containing protein [Frankia sp. AgB32]